MMHSPEMLHYFFKKMYRLENVKLHLDSSILLIFRSNIASKYCLGNIFGAILPELGATKKFVFGAILLFQLLM